MKIQNIPHSSTRLILSVLPLNPQILICFSYEIQYGIRAGRILRVLRLILVLTVLCRRELVGRSGGGAGGLICCWGSCHRSRRCAGCHCGSGDVLLGGRREVSSYLAVAGILVCGLEEKNRELQSCAAVR